MFGDLHRAVLIRLPGRGGSKKRKAPSTKRRAATRSATKGATRKGKATSSKAREPSVWLHHVL